MYVDCYYNMFESDDFDQILSQFDVSTGIPESNKQVFSSVVEKKFEKTFNTIPHSEKSCPNIFQKNCLKEVNSNHCDNYFPPKVLDNKCNKHTYNIYESSNDKKNTCIKNICNSEEINPDIKSHKHTKRKIINSHFDSSKRKFPGPAGLLTGQIGDNNESIEHVELHSQDVDFTQNYLQGNVFESPIWNRLKLDLKEWQLIDIDSIKNIKQQALAGNLRQRKAQIVTAFVETIDRSVTDPLIILQDTTGKIKGTLHRDAWSTFAPYIVSEYCALILWKPTVLTTGSGYKKHYLNITLNNIYALYSSAIIDDKDNTDMTLPEGYMKFQDKFTIFKAPFSNSNHYNDTVIESNLLDGLDDSLFNEDIF